ncbi:hypothetical protein [Pseudoalteromonas sp. T1lg23B]|nr:hypothetical protein [Pseudoalteromonas sp. T1lg23B]
MAIKTILFCVFAYTTMAFSATTSPEPYTGDNSTSGWCLVSPHLCDKE